MATIALFILTLTLSSTIHARESQFFNKFSNNTPKESQPLNTNDQQQPDFIPQTQDSGSYGLYGHQSGQLPPSTTTTTTNNNKNNNLPSYLPENYNPVAYTTPIHSSTQQVPNEFNDPQTYQYNGQNRLYNSQETNDADMYNYEKQGFDDARFMETEDVGNMYNSEKQVENERYNSEKQVENGRYNSQMQYGTRNNGNMYNPEKQGMSDTRFLENGKYFYDVNMENNNNYNANLNGRGYNSRNEYNTQGYYGNNGRGYNSRNEYNTQGYYGNNGRGYNSRNEYNTQGYYGNNEKYSYDRYNSNGGYQNEEDQYNP